MIEWLNTKMVIGAIYPVTPEQVRQIKTVWNTLAWHQYEWEFNESFTKFRKRENTNKQTNTKGSGKNIPEEKTPNIPGACSTKFQF